jgi:hypothetical protein
MANTLHSMLQHSLLEIGLVANGTMATLITTTAEWSRCSRAHSL